MSYVIVQYITLDAPEGGLGRRRAENGSEPLFARSGLAVLESAGSSCV